MVREAAYVGVSECLFQQGYLIYHNLYWDDKEKKGDNHTDIKHDQLGLTKTITRKIKQKQNKQQPPHKPGHPHYLSGYQKTPGFIVFHWYRVNFPHSKRIYEDMVLFSGFVTKPVLITHPCSSYC